MSPRVPLTDDRIGDWLQTASGGRFWPMDPRPEDVSLEDIAAALGRICRFGGHLRAGIEFYSVAQHSIEVMKMVPDDAMPAALFHDAAEAYVGDVIRPIKLSLWVTRNDGHMSNSRTFHDMERHILMAIKTRFGIPYPGANPLIHRADAIMLATERRDVMAPGPSWGALTEAPRKERLEHFWGPTMATEMFLYFAKELGIQ